MKKLFANEFYEEFADGAARAVYVQEWASQQEEKGKRLGPGDLMDMAPATPLSAYVWAGELIGRLTANNKASIYMLAAEAQKADKVDYIDAAEFGHYLAMQALGHGVSWFDDHAKFPIKIPHMEYSLP